MNNKPTPIEELVVFAYAMRREHPLLLKLSSYDKLTDGNVVYPYHVMMKISGQDEDTCLGWCEQAESNDLIEYGTTIKGGWLTEKGERVFEASSLEFNSFFDKAFESGIPTEIIQSWPKAQQMELITEMEKLETAEQPQPTRSSINPDFEVADQDNPPPPQNRSQIR